MSGAVEQLDIDSVIERLLSVRGQKPGAQVNLKESEIRLLWCVSPMKLSACASSAELFLRLFSRVAPFMARGPWREGVQHAYHQQYGHRGRSLHSRGSVGAHSWCFSPRTLVARAGGPIER